MKKITERVNNIEVSLIKQLPVMAYNLVKDGVWKQEDILSLGQGIPSMGTPEYITNSVIDQLKNNPNIGKYSLQPGIPGLKKAIAKNILRNFGGEVDVDKNLFISVGAMEALAITFMSILEKDDEVLLMDPSYASHIEQVILAEGKPVFVPLDAENNWQINVDVLRSKITKKTKAIVVCNPSNPTGMCFNKETLEAIIKISIENDLLIVGDETYRYLVYDNQEFYSLLNYPEVRDRLIYTYSFSKEFAMTGWRVGYMYAPEVIIKACLKVHDAFAICAPTVSQYAALAALTEKTEENSVDMVVIFEKRRNLMCEKLDELADYFSYMKPDGAYYILVKYNKSDLNSLDYSLKLLKETGVITIPGSGFGPQGEGYVRMSFCGEESEIEQAFERIKKWVH